MLCCRWKNHRLRSLDLFCLWVAILVCLFVPVFFSCELANRECLEAVDAIQRWRRRWVGAVSLMMWPEEPNYSCILGFEKGMFSPRVKRALKTALNLFWPAALRINSRSTGRPSSNENCPFQMAPSTSYERTNLGISGLLWNGAPFCQKFGTCGG